MAATGKKLVQAPFRGTAEQLKRWRRVADAIDRTVARFIGLACDYAAATTEGAIPVRKRGPLRAPSIAAMTAIQVRATDEQRALWKIAAARSRRTLADWMCRACDQFVGNARALYAPVVRSKPKKPPA
jgi:hypothetical protein